MRATRSQNILNFRYFANIYVIFPICFRFFGQPTISRQYRVSASRYLIFRPKKTTFCSLGIPQPVVTPQTRGSVDYSSTRGNTSGCRVTRCHFRKSGRVSFVRRALPKYKTCISCPKQCNIIQYIQSHE